MKAQFNMKTNFNSKLFDKKMELEASDFIFGGGTGSKLTTYDPETGDTITVHFNDEGEILSIKNNL